MTLIDRHVFTRLLSSLMKSVLALVLLFVLIDLLTHRRTEILRHDVPWTIVAEYYLCLIPRILHDYQIAALGMLVSALLVLGRMTQDNEVTALLSAGVGLRRVIVMPLIVGAGLTLAVFGMAETVGAAAAGRAGEIEERYFSRNPESERPGISWANLPGGWTCHIMKFNRQALSGEDVLMLAFRPGSEERIQAGRIYWDSASEQWLLEDGLWSVFDPEREMEARHTRITQTPAPIADTPEALFATATKTGARNSLELYRDIQRARARRMPVARLAVDFHSKFSKPFLCFVMIWLAVPFALRLRRGGVAIGTGVSVVIGLAYLILFSVTQGLGYVDRLDPWIAAWAANIVFLALGVTLFVRTPS